jgi:hypothetical protein
MPTTINHKAMSPGVRNWSQLRMLDETTGAAAPMIPMVLATAPNTAVGRPKRLFAMGTHHKRYPREPIPKLRTVWRGRAE